MKTQFSATLRRTPDIMIQKGTHGRESASQKFLAAVVIKTGTADHAQMTRKFLLVLVISSP
jgi:hypothetical protein